MLHNFQVSTYTVLFSFILLVLVSGSQLSSPGSFYFLFSLSAFLQSFLNINIIVRARVSECRSYETRSFGGPYFRFCSL